jgi:branched-chain amino acid transport system substrate-binding protein
MRVNDHSRVVPSLLALAICGALAGCEPKAIRFGAVLPLSGTAAVYGKAIRSGIELAYEQAQKNPEIDGPIELAIVDSGADPDRARRSLREIYSGGAIAAIGGVTSAEALAMVEIADKEGRVLLSPSASNPQLTGISSNFYRIFPSDFAEGTVMARYSYDNLRLRAGVVIAKEETYAKGIQKVFAEEFTRKGGRIIESVEYPENMNEFGAIADHAVTLKPDFVYVAAYAQDVASIIQELRRHEYGGIILTTHSFAAADTIEKMANAAEGVYLTQATFDPNGELAPAQREFVASYRARYGEMPDLYAAHGFDAFNILLEAYRLGGTSGLSFWKGMRGVRDYLGVTGILQFDEKGDVSKFPHVYIVADGRPVDVEQRRQEEIQRARQEIERIQREMERLRDEGN